MKLASVLPVIIFMHTLSSVKSQLMVQEALKSRAELTNYEETSRYEDALRFFTQLQRCSPFIRIESFGRSSEGRNLVLAILSDPPVAQLRESRALNKPTVLILANIHAGEVEGKEAAQHVARRLLAGDLQPLLKRLIVLIVPNYNADGNERISLTNRFEQNGPIGGVGRRENAQGLDLNRDFIKVEAPETRSLLRLLKEWDPQLTVDLHTTDGSYHGYHLTYSIPLNPSLNPMLTDYHREKLMPAITTAMLKRHKFRTYYYGNFSGDMPEAPAQDERAWFTFSPQPRVGFNYFGFRNRLCILSEAYSYLDFQHRVEVTTAFVEEILRYAAGHGAEIRRLTQKVDSQSIERGLKGSRVQIGVEYRPKALPKPVPILIGQVRKIKNPRSGRQMLAMVEDKVTAVKMRDYGMFEATRSVPVANAYVFEEALAIVRDKLLDHGITVEQLTAPVTLRVQHFRIAKMERQKRSFQGHQQVTLRGNYETQEMEFPVGTVIVRTSQPLGLLSAYLLEPESEDGFVTWNFFDAYLKPGTVFPIYKLMQQVNLATEVVKR